MSVKNDNTPIPLPPLIRVGDPITASWANSIRLSIQRLRDRKPLFRQARLGKSSDCPFGYVFSELGEGDPPEVITKLRGGIVAAGIDIEEVEDIELELKDESGDPHPDGTFLFLVVDVTAITADDLIMPGIETLDSVETLLVVPPTPLPANRFPTNTDPTGVLYIPLGSIQNGAFIPSLCGNKQITHCPGQLLSQVF